MRPVLKGAARGASGPVDQCVRALAILYSGGTLAAPRVCLVQAQVGGLCPGKMPRSPQELRGWEASHGLRGILIHRPCTQRLFVVAAVVSAQTPVRGWHTHLLDAGPVSQLRPSLGIALSRGELCRSRLRPLLELGLWPKTG